MDLICREAVANELEKNMYSEDFCSEHMIDYSINMGMAKITVASMPSAFEGMTIGEVLKTVLGIEDEQIVEAKYLVSIYPKGNHYDPFIAIKREAWNSPYQKRGK